jgi:hypothetical protein
MSTFRRWVMVVVVLAFWALAGPVGGAFGGCAAMSAMCDGPCGVCVSAPTAPQSTGVVSAVSMLTVSPAVHWPSASLKVPEPPPKLLLRST